MSSDSRYSTRFCTVDEAYRWHALAVAWQAKRRRDQRFYLFWHHVRRRIGDTNQFSVGTAPGNDREHAIVLLRGRGNRQRAIAVSVYEGEFSQCSIAKMLFSLLALVEGHGPFLTAAEVDLWHNVISATHVVAVDWHRLALESGVKP